MENKPIIPAYQIAFVVMFLIVLIIFVGKIAFWLSNQVSEEDSQKVIELIENAKPTIQESFWLPDCRITQWESEHHKTENGHILAIDIACTEGMGFWVHAPYTFEDYEYVYRWTDKRLWDYHVIKSWETRYIFGHTGIAPVSVWIPQIWDKIKSWTYIGYTNLSWISTNYHLHVEKWVWKNNVSMVDGRINEFSSKLCEQREWWFCASEDKQDIKSKFYFTHYDLWDIKQNDSAPCHGASGVDLCFLARNWVHTMALTVDIRKQLWVKWWDKVILEGDEGCRGIYEVHDEMAKRFRISCIKRPWTNFCIKWDLPWKVWGACTVHKVTY